MADEKLPGSPPEPPKTRTSKPILRPALSKTPQMLQGITTDQSGRLPVQVPAQSMVVADRQPDTPKIGQFWYRHDLQKICVQADKDTVICFCSCGSTVPIGSYAAFVLTYVGTSLIGYWRLGEESGNWLDSSGMSPPAPMGLVSRGAALTRHVTGALPAVFDDGALQFPYLGDYGSAGGGVSGGGRFDFTSSAAAHTVSCWVKVNANATSFNGFVVGNLLSSPDTGWAISMSWPTRTIAFQRQNIGGTFKFVSGGSLVAGAWVHVAATYSGSSTHTISIYLNGVLIQSDSTVSGGLPAWNAGITVGGSNPNVSTNYYFDGVMDELAIWNVALSPTEILALYNLGIHATLVDEGKVLTADGLGSTSWEYPIKVQF